ncbi:MAG: sigma-70 family RNA polymerase sigma factor [Actinobacteria bacterium]|nr:sigma-70 family RNA polymerase sigma factor [Actinomycetota bacterium]
MTARPRTEPLPDGLTLYMEEMGRYDLLTADEEVELAQAIEAGREAAERLESGDYDGKVDQTRLRREARLGRQAKDRFVASNLRLVVANARRFANANGLEMGDLVQEGNLGLIRAVEKFDWRKGFKFSTYATWWIRQALQRAVAEKSRVVRIPVHLHETLGTIRSASSTLRGILGREPRPEEIAEETGIDLAQVERALAVSSEVSIEQPVGEDGAELADFIADADADDIGLAAERADVARELRSAVSRLDERERYILTARFGFGEDGIPRTLEEIGGSLKLTPERIRQLEKRALAKLRHPAFGLREEDLV